MSMMRAQVVAASASALAILAIACGPPPEPFEIRGASVVELQEAMELGRASSAWITQAYLDRIAAFDQTGPAINAMVSLNPNAMAEAEALDRERADGVVRGPLHGVPIVLKDNYDTRDAPTSAGTAALSGFVPPDDAFQVGRLREAGAVFLGKTNMHELASGWTTVGSLGGQTLNPYDLTRHPGGSSGGTGAAVAASFAAVGWGSDTCGSIRLPSAYNNLVGLRPTKGLSSIDGIVPLSHSQDVGGPLARTVRDLAIALDATIGPDAADPDTSILDGGTVPSFVAALDVGALDGVRVGIYTPLFGDAPEDGEVRRLVREAVGVMVDLGADTVTVTDSVLVEIAAQATVIASEFKWDLMDYLTESGAPVGSLKEMIDMGVIHEAVEPLMRTWDATESRDSEDYQGRLGMRITLREGIEQVMDREDIDVLVYPTARQLPSRIGDPQNNNNCRMSGHSGLPALSLPVGFTEQGLPVGMEVLGRMFEDARLLGIGYAFEQSTHHRRDPATTPILASGGTS
ncbi:MAG: amidase [Gemmatimonadales bacterium]|nr:amidase [Gemmatimonadales bacterium]